MEERDKKVTFAPLLQKRASMAQGDKIFSMFKEAMATGGVPLGKPQTESQKEKVADAEVDAMQAKFLQDAEDAIMTHVSANVYRDPILAGLVEHGMITKAAELATGRVAGKEVMTKWASLPLETIQELGAAGLGAELVEKVAGLEQEEPVHTTHFPNIMKLGGKR